MKAILLFPFLVLSSARANETISRDNSARVRETNPSVLAGAQLASSADHLISTIYQNCKASEIFVDLENGKPLAGVSLGVPPKIDKKMKDELIATHPYLSATCKSQPPGSGKTTQPVQDSSCVNVCSTPPIYAYGRGRDLAATQGPVTEINPFDRISGPPPFYGMDCSAFVGNALMGAGLNILPNGQAYAYSAGALSELGNAEEGKDCFEVVDFENSTFQAGDMIAWEGHVMIVSRAGADPLGVEKHITDLGITKGADCSKIGFNLKAEHLDFDIAHSVNYRDAGGLVGVSKVRASDYYKHSRIISVPRLAALAVKACKARFQVSCPAKIRECRARDQECARAGAQNEKSQQGRLCAAKKKSCRLEARKCSGARMSYTDSNGESRYFSVIRHVGSRNPSCVVAGPRPKFVGEGCMGGCK